MYGVMRWGMEWIYRLRWDSRECDGFIKKGIEVIGDQLMQADDEFSLYNKEVFVYWVKALIWVLALFLC